MVVRDFNCEELFVRENECAMMVLHGTLQQFAAPHASGFLVSFGKSIAFLQTIASELPQSTMHKQVLLMAVNQNILVQTYIFVIFYVKIFF